MASNKLLGFAAAVGILALGFVLASGRSTSGVIVVSLITVFALLAVVNRAAGGYVAEVLVSGLVLAVVEAYHFFIQPNIVGLPDLGTSGALFFGFVTVFRILLLVIESTPNPLRAPLRKVVGR